MTTFTLVAAAVWLSQFVELPPLPLHPVPLIRSPLDEMTPLARQKNQRELHQAWAKELERTDRAIKEYEAKAREFRRGKNEERAKYYEDLARIEKEHRVWRQLFIAIVEGTAMPAEKKQWREMLNRERDKTGQDLIDRRRPTSPPVSPPDRRQTPNERE